MPPEIKILQKLSLKMLWNKLNQKVLTIELAFYSTLTFKRCFYTMQNNIDFIEISSNKIELFPLLGTLFIFAKMSFVVTKSGIKVHLT